MNVQHRCFSLKVCVMQHFFSEWTFLAFSVADDLINCLSESETNYTLIVLAK